MESINVLLLGSGGREHALAWKIKQSDYCKELYVAPGNAGTGSFATNVTLNLNDYEQLQEFALAYQIDLVVVGSEGPLVGGIVDFFKGNDEDGYIPVFGPCSAGAGLEGSKIFAKEFMHRHRIPTGSFDKFSWKEHQKAINYLQQIEFPVVIKANGLASGKGVKVCENQNQALETLEAYFKERALGDSGKKIVIEEFLEGQELSMFVLTDGDQYIMLPDSKDYKRVGEGDKGPNTGGMGAISPSMYLDNNLLEHVKNDIIIPTLNGLKHDGIHYKGFLYFGVIVTADGPKVLEYNARLGDPEAQAVLPRIQNDLLPLMYEVATHKLHHQKMDISQKCASTVVLISDGYPGQYEKGKAVKGMNEVKNSIVFHAGTKLEDSHTLTNGGRVLNLTALGPDLESALKTVYQDVDKVKFEGVRYRRDIGREVIGELL